MTYQSTILADNPIRYYRLNETSGLVATDIGSQAQNGTLSGTITLNQPSLLLNDTDASMLCTGTTANIAIPNTGLPTGGSPWTLEAWVQIPASPVTFQEMFNFGTSSTNQKVTIFWSGSALFLSAQGATNSIGYAVSTSTTYHVVATYDGTTQVLYLNGVAVISLACTYNIVANIARIGHAWVGNIDEVAIYSTALSAAQVLAHYLAQYKTPVTGVFDGFGVYESVVTLANSSIYQPRLDQIAAAGFKLVMNYSLLNGHIADVIAYINYAASKGLQVIVSLHNPTIWKTGTYTTGYANLYADSGNAATGILFAQYIVNQTKGLTGTWGWYIGDEVVNSDHTVFAPYAAAIRTADSTHPRLIIESAGSTNSVGSGTNLYFDSCEVLGSDNYPIASLTAPTDDVLHRIIALDAANTQAFDDTKGLRSAMVLQAHSYANYGFSGYPWPTQAQMKIMKDAAMGQMQPRLILWYSYFDVISGTAPANQWYYLVAACGLYKWTYDTVNSRLLPGPLNTLLTYNNISAVNSMAHGILNMSYLSGLIARYTDPSNYYSLLVSDDQGQYPQTMRLSKTVAGVTTLLTSVAISFMRNTYHTVQLTINGTTLVGSFDGAALITTTDSALSASGLAGLYSGGGTSGMAAWYDFGARALGDNAVGKAVYTRARLTSTDPTVTPQLTSLVAVVLGPDLSAGVLIHDTKYSYKNSVAACIDDAASQSGLVWRMNKDKRITMPDRNGVPAPFVVATANGNIDGVTPPVLTKNSPLYRNRQHVTGAVTLSIVSESKTGDALGVSQSWVLKYPVFSMTSMALDNVPQTFGVQGVDTGKAFYWTQNQANFSMDSSLLPPTSSQQLDIVYVGIKPYTSMRENVPQQLALAAIDGSSGIVEYTEDCGGLGAAAADVICQSRIDQYAKLTRLWNFPTHQSGLSPGQIVTAQAPEIGITDDQFLITAIDSSVQMLSDNSLLYTHNVQTTDGSNTGSWHRVFAALRRK